MSDHDRTHSTPEPEPESEPVDASETHADVEAEIDDAAPEELDAVVDALPGSGKLDTSRDDLDDAAGGPMQIP